MQDRNRDIFYNTTEFFDIATEVWISPEVETGNVTDLAVAFHSAASFPNLPGSPIVIYGGIVAINVTATENPCVGNVRILQSELHGTESQNRLIWREGQSGLPRCLHAAVAVGSHMVVFGGISAIVGSTESPFNNPQDITTDIHIYSPLDNTWTTRKHSGGPSPAREFQLLELWQ